MSFFEQQYKARKRTGRLVLLFLIAVVLTVTALNAAAYFIARFSFPEEYLLTLEVWLNEPYWVWITGVTLLVIVIGSLRTLFKLSGGGRSVAQMVGARRIKMSSQDPHERRLINVVEEMSIASGTPVPALYVMDEENRINAFVAGYRANQAVLVVTRGTLETLDRDELQGVVGHEYSHILNGDMRINIRLMAALAGILVLGQLGGFMLRGMRFSGRGGKGGGGAPVLAAALALFAIGYIGLFFGRLIKAAISRQREYLADASSVQFTRNPAAIAGALWKIKTGAGSRLVNSHAEDMSHMCIAESLKFSALLATHPPLDDRINAVDPHFLTKKKFEKPKPPAPAPADPIPAPGGAGAPGDAMGLAGGESVPITATTEGVTASVGNPSAQHMDYAHHLHAALPVMLLNAAHSDGEAVLVVYALILAGTHDEAMGIALPMVKAHEGEAGVEKTRELILAVERIGARGRLPLLDIVLPELKELPSDARSRFLGTVKALIKVDKRFTLFEFVLATILTNHLADDAGKADRIKYDKADPVLDEIRVLMTVLARVGADSPAAASQAFAQVMRYFTNQTLTPADKAEFTPERLSEVLTKLSLLSPLVKQTVIAACTDCVLHDGKVMPAEAELLRATALTLDCPMPPLISDTEAARALQTG